MWDGKDPGLPSENERTTRQEAAEAQEVDRCCAIAEVLGGLRYLKLRLTSDARLCVELETLVALALNAGADFGVRPSEVLR